MKKSKRLFELCGDILFPRRCPFCDAVLGFSGPCAVCGPALACIRRPLRQPVPKQGHALEHLDAAYAPYFYEPPVRDAVLRLKFENRTDLARPLALLQAEALKAAGCLGDVDALVPVPSGRGERRSRGYDVPLMLARALGRELGLPVMQALCKIRETPRQMALSGGERRKNLKHAFSARPDALLEGKRILLVDDVLTTGSTLNECAKALRAAGAAECRGVCATATRLGRKGKKGRARAGGGVVSYACLADAGRGRRCA